jgi:tripartite-type tricarboxylate transporter receptor subunit TctC
MTEENMKRFLIALLLVPILAIAQSWEPTKTVTVLIPTTPASGNEMAARAVISQLEKTTKYRFIIENRPGADGNIMLKQLLEAEKDGHTIGIPSCVSTFLFTDIHFTNLIKTSPMDLELITNIGKSPMAFVANSNSSVKTIPQLITAVKSGRKIDVAVGGTAHLLAWIYFMDKVGGNTEAVQTINYKGPVPAVTDTAAGVTEFGVMPIAVAQTLVPTGKIRVLGIAGEQKLAGMDQSIPLLKDTVPGLNVYGCWVAALPPGTPKPIVKWYTDNFVPMLKTAEYQRFMTDNMIFLDSRAVGPAGVRRDLTDLRTQWQPYVRRMPAPN